MSDGALVRSAPRKALGRGALGAIWAAAAGFLVLLALLAMRVGAGQDPALRARAAATPPPARRVLIRRVYERRVIVHLPPTAPAQPSRAFQEVSSDGGSPSPMPVTRTS